MAGKGSTVLVATSALGGMPVESTLPEATPVSPTRQATPAQARVMAPTQQAAQNSAVQNPNLVQAVPTQAPAAAKKPKVNILDQIKNTFNKKSQPRDPTKRPGEINVKLPSFSEVKEKVINKVGNKYPAGREINLVPDVKDEMIKALKLRNLTFFLCIVVASASIVVMAIFASIAGGQQAIVDAKKTTISNLSNKVSVYSDLGDFLTIRDQLGNLSSIASNKKLLSRTFTILSALLPTGANTITMSELSIDLSSDSPIISFDAQANAGEPPYIDYNVLDSFKKSMAYMRYDFGDYVDREGETIPAYCMIDNGADGATLSDPEKGYYAYWLITGEGCNPSYVPDYDNNGNEIYIEADALKGYTIEEYEGQKVVKVWRTPQFSEWYAEEEKSNKPYMGLDGTITNVAHFESECTSYFGTENDNGEIVWASSNEECMLVPEGSDGINISDSSNGRGAGDELVLRFSASIVLNPDAYSFSNHHLLAVAPSGRWNVTDSYLQIQNMFEQRAADCASDDAVCVNATTGGGL